MERTINGNLDEFNFPFIGVGVSNPLTSKEMVIKSIIDTGAAHCLLQKEIIDELGLNKVSDSTIMHPVNGLLQSGNYLIDLILDIHNPIGSAKCLQVRVGTLDQLDYPAGMIIGVEFLQFCKFDYNGFDKTFTLNFRI